MNFIVYFLFSLRFLDFFLRMSLSRDLIALRSESDRNMSVIANLTHEVALASAQYEAKESAYRMHLKQLQEDLRDIQAKTAELEGLSAPNQLLVPIARVDCAKAALAEKKRALNDIRKETETLESLLKLFLPDETLQLAEHFDLTKDDDRLALAMLQDSRVGTLN